MSPRLRLTRFQLGYGALIALGLAAGGWQTWLACQQGKHAMLAILSVTCCVALTAVGLVALWMAPVLEDRPLTWLRDLPLGPERMKRLGTLLDFLPEETPPGWSPLFSPRGSTAWCASSDGVLVATWLAPYEHGHHVHVALGRKDGGSLSNAYVGEILAHFRGVGPFWEMDSAPEFIRDSFPPYVRTWVALPYETIEKVPVPAKPPSILDAPLNAHLRAVRKHLPARLPAGWSAPLAITEQREGWKGGAWVVENDDAAFAVCLVGAQGRAKLLVTIWCPSGETVDEGRALGILKHFRGVSEFAQCEDDGEIEGARSYLGEVEAAAPRAMLS